MTAIRKKENLISRDVTLYYLRCSVFNKKNYEKRESMTLTQEKKKKSIEIVPEKEANGRGNT